MLIDPLTGLPPRSQRKYLRGCGQGKPTIDRMLSNEPQDKFDIYNSVIQGDPDDQDNSDDDDEEVKYLKKKIKKLQQ